MSAIDTLRTEHRHVETAPARASSVTDADSLRAALQSAEITIPQLLRRRAAMHGDALALREKEYGIWNPYSWSHYYETARAVALGLLSLGLKPGDRVAILAWNCPEIIELECALYKAGLVKGAFGDGKAPALSEDASDPKPGDSYVRSFARGLAVLRSFGADARAQTLTEVAERTGLTRAGARRILLTLLHLGYVTTEGRLFCLTPKVLELGFAYLSSLPVWTQAQPVMEGLVEELRQSCSAAVLDGDEIVYVVRVPAHRIMSVNLGVGSRLPADCSSMGRVLLAGLPPDQLKQRVDAMTLVAHTPQTITDKDQLLAAIEQVRIQGWSLVNQELEEGLISLAAPLTNRAGQTVAALNISGQANRTSAEVMQATMLPALLRAAQTISRMLGTQRN